MTMLRDMRTLLTRLQTLSTDSSMQTKKVSSTALLSSSKELTIGISSQSVTSRSLQTVLLSLLTRKFRSTSQRLRTSSTTTLLLTLSMQRLRISASLLTSFTASMLALQAVRVHLQLTSLRTSLKHSMLTMLTATRKLTTRIHTSSSSLMLMAARSRSLASQ